MLRQIYFSPLGRFMSALMALAGRVHRPFMVYGYRDRVSGAFRRRTRISSTAVMTYSSNISMADDVWVWHYTILDGSCGIKIGEGAQIGAWVGIFTHGSQAAIRLYGKRYIEVDLRDRKGYTRGAVEVGEYSFIGARSMLLPGTRLGKGCLVAAGSTVNGNIPDFSIVRGNPAKVVGDVRSIDAKFMDDPELRNWYFDSDGMVEWVGKHSQSEEASAAAPTP